MSGLLLEYSRKGHSCNIDGVNIFYSDWGSGEEVIVCLHGFLSTGFHFRKLSEELSKEFRVICVDLVGVGFSQRPDTPLSHRLQANYLVKLFDSILPQRKIHFIVQDYGLIILSLLLKERPEIAKSLCILNGFLDITKWKFPFPLKLFRVPIISDLFFFLLNPYLVKLIYNWSLAKKGFDFGKEWAKATFELLYSKERRRNTKEFHKNVDRSTHVLRELETGAKSFVGLRQIFISTEDPWANPQETEFLKETLRTRGVVFLEAGHFPQEEDSFRTAEQIRTVISSASKKVTRTFHFPRENMDL